VSVDGFVIFVSFSFYFHRFHHMLWRASSPNPGPLSSSSSSSSSSDATTSFSPPDISHGAHDEQLDISAAELSALVSVAEYHSS